MESDGSEHIDKWYHDLKEFCDDLLVYLEDDGLVVNVVRHPLAVSSSNALDLIDGELAYVNLTWYTDHSFRESESFNTWNDIKDSMIPFFTHLSNVYNVVPFNKMPKTFNLGVTDSSQVQFILKRRAIVNGTFTHGRFSHPFTIKAIEQDNLDLGNNHVVEIRFYVTDMVDFDLSQLGQSGGPVGPSSIGKRIKSFLGF
jgi:hypothetical protein